MLEPWIIEQIRRREEEQRRRDDRPQLELPLGHDPRPPRKDRDRPRDERSDPQDRERRERRDRDGETPNPWDSPDHGSDRAEDEDSDEPKRGVVIIGL
jgi:hypothetical protein